MSEKDIITTLKLARYKILVALRPLPQARLAYNIVVTEFASRFVEPTRSQISDLQLEEI